MMTKTFTCSPFTILLSLFPPPHSSQPSPHPSTLPYCNDEENVVTLGLLGDAASGIFDGLVQEGREVGGTIKLNLTQCVAVHIQDTLEEGGRGGVCVSARDG